MAEALADHDDVDAGGEHERGLAVAQVVQADAAQAGLRDELGEPVGEPVGVQRDAVGAGEDQVVVVVGNAEGLPGGVLAEPVLEQDADGVGVEVDDAVLAAGGLGAAEGEAAMVGAAHGAGPGERGGEGHDLLAHVQPGAVEVDVGPAQAEGLAAAQPGGGEQLEGGAELVVVGVVEESAELLGLPGAHVRARD